MGLVRYGGGVVQISGSIAGDTFARNRSGNYIRARTVPINPQSARQVKVRAIIATLTEEWYDVLTAANRAAWELYADNVAWQNKLGETIHLSGFNMFIRSNSVLLDIGAAQVNAGPVDFTLPDQDPAFAIAGSAATQQFTVTFDDTLAWASEDNAYMTFLCGAPQNVTRNYFNGPWQGTRFLTGNAGAPLASPLPIGALFAIAQGQKAWVKARIIRADARLSTDFTAFCTVGA